ncbi:MAG: proton-conducting transporter membrane subunit, partial [Planctomycetota bacterium]
PTAMTVVATVGALTALFAGTIGIAQNDIKKVLAYSTVSQLGFMFMGVGVGAFAAGIFHLFTHAFFKACLFLGSGSVIHGMGGEQDIRKMGGLRSKMPWTFATFAVATLAIAGIPPLAGFFSKDEILWQTFRTHRLLFPGWILWGVGALAALCTAFYMTRLVIKTCRGRRLGGAPTAFSGGGVDLPEWMEEDEEEKKPKPKPPRTGTGPEGLPLWMDEDEEGAAAPGTRAQDLPQDESLLDLRKVGPAAAGAHAASAGHAPGAHAGEEDAHGAAGHGAGHGGHGHGHGEPHECPWSMRLALVVLAACSAVVGFLGVPPALGGQDLFGHWLEPVVGSLHGEHSAAEYAVMAVSLLLAVAGIAAAWRIYSVRHGVPARDFAESHRELYELVRDKYRVDEVYDRLVVQPLLRLEEGVGRFDNEVIDGLVNGTARGGSRTAGGAGLFDNEVVDAAVNAAAEVTQEAGRRVRRLQTGNVRQYLNFALVGGLFVIAVFCVVLTWDRLRTALGI